MTEMATLKLQEYVWDSVLRAYLRILEGAINDMKDGEYWFSMIYNRVLILPYLVLNKVPGSSPLFFSGDLWNKKPNREVSGAFPYGTHSLENWSTADIFLYF
jgi:hypothetical protein